MLNWLRLVWGYIGFAKYRVKPAPELSSRTLQLVKILFVPGDQLFVSNILMSRCGFNLPGTRYTDEKHIERVRCSVLKLSDGSVGALLEAIDLAQIDVRDVFMNAGFTSPTDHEHWLPSKQ